MNRKLRALLSLCLAVCLGLGSIPGGLASSLDYTVVEKLQKQLEAGSGFTGTLSLALTAVPGREGEAITTTSPIVLDLSYIYAREDTASGIPAERRLSLFYPSEAIPQAALYFSLMDTGAYLKSNLLSAQWFALQKSAASSDNSASLEGAAAQSEENFLTQAVAGLLGKSPMPSIIAFLASLGAKSQVSPDDKLTEALAPYLTKIDLWIEGYRQNAVLGKLEDGTTTMEVNYVITPAAIKSQLKQLTLDVLSDAVLLPALQAMLPKDQAGKYLNPQLQSHYFSAIDSLPLADELTISRTVSLKGETLALYIHLPFYDAKGGVVSLDYHRTTGEGDLPDENVLSIENREQILRLEYQAYHSITDVTVYQGTLLRAPQGLSVFEVAQTETQPLDKVLSAAFTLTHKQLSAVDPAGLETMTHDLQLSVSPLLTAKDDQGDEISLTQEEMASYLQFPAFDITANAVFASKPAKNASTSIQLALTFGGEDIPQVLELNLSGKSTAKWSLDAFDPTSLPVLPLMSQTQLEDLLSKAALQAGLLFLPLFRLPQGIGGQPTPTPAGNVVGSLQP
ncbi:MAG: hypothetical protein GXY67_01390 [Clostridiales bacterium]|nr:hypothetical protein [Clostridiales bacterium]